MAFLVKQLLLIRGTFWPGHYRRHIRGHVRQSEGNNVVHKQLTDKVTRRLEHNNERLVTRCGIQEMTEGVNGLKLLRDAVGREVIKVVRNYDQSLVRDGARLLGWCNFN
jgi:hypothetical protein